MYVDVHAHIVHPHFAGEEDAVAQRAAAAGLGVVVVNGLEPRSNRAVLELCARHANLRAALGIYPVDAGAAAIDRAAWKHDFPPPEPFDIDAEIAFIDAHADEIVAIGECGLDAYWAAEALPLQEEVLRKLCAVARRRDLPMILHTRKAEQRCFEILQEEGIERADFHCFGGKAKLGRKIAEAGYYLSIPPVVERAESFQALARILPLDRILTETDCPYMGPDRGERNEPANVPRGVRAIAAARGEDEAVVAAAIVANYRRLFGERA